MDGQIKSQAEADEDVLTFDVPDAALERAECRAASLHLGVLH
jgi:hypothetical protein